MITISAATGRIGRLVVRELLLGGFAVDQLSLPSATRPRLPTSPTSGSSCATPTMSVPRRCRSRSMALTSCY
jgi:hypothetical protein